MAKQKKDRHERCQCPDCVREKHGMTTEEMADKLLHDIEHHWTEEDKQRFRQALQEDLESAEKDLPEYDRDPEAWNRAYAAKYVRQLNSKLKIN